MLLVTKLSRIDEHVSARRYRTIGLIVIILVLNGCAALGMRRDIPQAEKSAIRSIGVVAIMGNKFHSTHIGTTIFTNELHDMDVADWRVDEHAIAEAVKVLADIGSYEVKSLGTTHADASAAIRAGAQAGVDAVIVMAPVRYDNQPHFRGGYGFHRRKYFGLQQDCIYALFTSHIYLTSSGKDLGWEWSFPASTGIQCAFKDSPESQWLQSMEFPETPESYTAEQLQKMRAGVMEVVSRSVDFSLRNLGL